jgi:hypothetical protein
MATSRLDWTKSSYSGSQGGNCVEAAADGRGAILVRDTQDRAGALLTFEASPWRQFAASLKIRKALSLLAELPHKFGLTFTNLRGSVPRLAEIRLSG